MDLPLTLLADRLGSLALVPAEVCSLVVSETDLLSWLLFIVLSGDLLVWLGCSFVKRDSPSRLCSGRA